VLDRIDVDIVDVSRKIPFISDGVLPIATLPNATLALADPTRRNCFATREFAREGRFDQTPARCEVCVALRHCPDRMKMVWQDDDGIDRERVPLARLAKRRTQDLDMRR